MKGFLIPFKILVWTAPAELDKQIKLLLFAVISFWLSHLSQDLREGGRLIPVNCS